MKKRLITLVGALLGGAVSLFAVDDVSLPLSTIMKGWGWNCTYSYDTLNPSKTGAAASIEKLTKVKAAGSGAFSIASDNFSTFVTDWTQYDKIEMLVYSSTDVAFGAKVIYKGWDGSANVGASSDAAVSTATITANTWQVVTIDITKPIVNDVNSSIKYTSLNDAALGVNTIMLSINGASDLCVASVTVKAKSSTPPTTLTLTPATITLIPGKTFSLNLAVTPSDALKDVTYSSNKTEVATVDAGIVTSVAPGSATITATSTVANSVTASSVITVEAAKSSDNKTYGFEKADPFDNVWGAATSTVVENPTKGDVQSGNSSDSVAKVTMKQWNDAFVISTGVDLNLYTKISLMVYSETELADFSLKMGINNGEAGMLTASLPAKKWTKLEWIVNKYNTATDAFFIQLASNGAATSAYTFMVDSIMFFAAPEAVKPTNESEKSAIEVTMYPNPAATAVSVSSDEVVATIEILTENGQVVKSVAAQTSIDVADLAKGTYFVRVSTASGKKVTKQLVK